MPNHIDLGAPAHIIDPVDFILRFTPAEYAAMEDSTDPQVRYLMRLVGAAKTINLQRDVTIQGVQYLEMIGLIAEDRAQEILTVG